MLNVTGMSMKMIKGKQKMQQGGDVNSKISCIIAMKPYSNNLSKTATKIVEVEGGMDWGC